MSEFMILFRKDINEKQLSQEEWEELGKKWWQWRSGLESQNKIASSGNRLSKAGKVVKQNNVVTDGPYAEIKEMLAGFMVIKAEDFDEAIVIAKGCPIILSGGNVEIRKFIAPDDNES